MRQGAGRTARQAPRQAHGQQDRAEIGQRRPGAATTPQLRQPDRPDRTGDCQDHRDPLGHRRKCHRGRAVVPPDLSSSPLIPDHRRHGRPAPYRAPGRSHRGAAARPHPRIKAHRPAPGRRRQRHRPARGAAVPDRMTAPRKTPQGAMRSSARRDGRAGALQLAPCPLNATPGKAALRLSVSSTADPPRCPKPSARDIAWTGKAAAPAPKGRFRLAA